MPSEQRRTNPVSNEDQCYSRQQITRLIKQYTDKGRPKCKHRTARGFSKRYTDEDVRLLAHMDRLHNTPNGLTLKKLFERAYQMFNQTQYQRLAGISIAHLYNLRKSKTDLRIRRPIMYKDVLYAGFAGAKTGPSNTP